MNPRNYQELAIDGFFEAIKRYNAVCLMQATGTGKTVVFAHIIKRMQPLRAMVLAHRNELIIQAKEKIEHIAGVTCGVEKAELWANEGMLARDPVVVSSIQTQCSGPKDKRRYLRFNPMDFGLLVCDEAHHAASPSWKEVIAHYRKNPNLKVLGCTATIDRADKKGLGVFDFVEGTKNGCYFTYDILQAIQDGYLVDITQQFVPVKSLDFSHIKTTAGDLNEGQLAKLMEMEENIQGICQPTLEAMFGLTPKTLHAVPVEDWRTYLTSLNRTPRRTIVFTVSVVQAELCSNIFSRAMDGVDWICGKTRPEKRLELTRKFRSGALHCVVNVGVFTEGADFPAVELIAQARPTKSRSLYAQIIGRSTRPLTGLVDSFTTAEERKAAIAASPKPFCRILDFAGNSGKHKLVTCADILGEGISEEAKELANKQALEDGKPRKILVTMQNAELELERQRREAVERAKAAEEARKARLLARVDYSVKNVDPFGGPLTNVPSRFSRDGMQFSEKQARLLRRYGYDPATLRYGAGKAIIGKIFQSNGWKQKNATDPAQSARLAVAGKDNEPPF